MNAAGSAPRRQPRHGASALFIASVAAVLIGLTPRRQPWAAVAPHGSLWLPASGRDGRQPGSAREDGHRIARLIVSEVETARAA